LHININKSSILVNFLLIDIPAIPGALLLGCHDFTAKETQDKILSLLQGKKPDIIMRYNLHITAGNDQ